jgi:DNA-binding LytR/AlgR family response regulator
MMKQGMIRVLIVEDEMAIAMDVESRLLKMGFQVTAIVLTREEAEQAFAAQQPDVVLQDIQLGDKHDGIALSAHYAEHGCPVVFLTAFGDQKTFAEALSTAPAGYVTKPFRDDDLRRQLELAVFRQARLREMQDMVQMYEQFLSLYIPPAALLDSSRCFLRVPPALERLNGFLAAEMNGKPVSDFFVLVPGTDQVTHLLHRNKERIPYPAKLIAIQSGTDESSLGFALQPDKAENETEIERESPVINTKAVFIRDKSVLYRVPFENIYWLEAMDNYTKIHTQQKTYTIKLFLKDALSRLPSDKFVRIHRSYAVALEHISMLEEDTLYIGSTGLPVGKQYWNDIKAWFKFS